MHNVASLHFNPLYFSSVHYAQAAPNPGGHKSTVFHHHRHHRHRRHHQLHHCHQHQLDHRHHYHHHHHGCHHQLYHRHSHLHFTFSYVSLLQKISPITTLSHLNFRLKSVFQTFNSEATFAFVEFFVFCQILIHFCQSAKADQADLPFIGKLRPEADPENPKSWKPKRYSDFLFENLFFGNCKLYFLLSSFTSTMGQSNTMIYAVFGITIRFNSFF